MMVPAVVGSVFAGSVVEWVSILSTSALVLWSKVSGPAPDPVEELTYRLRHPCLWAAQHPIKAAKRMSPRRRS